MVGGGTDLGKDCLPGGVIDNAATVLSCGMQAIQQVESFSFDGKIDLLALFPLMEQAQGRSDTDERRDHCAR